MSAIEKSGEAAAPAGATAPAATAAPAPGARPIDHPARPDDRDHGKVAMRYEGYRVPIWVVLPWLIFLAWGAVYLVMYLLPTAAGPH